MLPNKIYAGFDKNTHLESYCTEKKGKCQTEYIRKDALLDWLKAVKADVMIPMNIDRVIAKIESL